MSEQNRFQIGDTVTWTSQAGGNAKTKTGKVVVIVRPHTSLYRALEPEQIGRFTLKHLHGTRGHESYLIQVGKSKRLYWPLVKYLERAEPSPLEQYKREAGMQNCGMSEKEKQLLAFDEMADS